MERFVKRRRHFILDLRKVPFINSAALGVFVNIYKHLDTLDAQLVLCELNPDIENLLEITRLSSVFPVTRTVAAAEWLHKLDSEPQNPELRVNKAEEYIRANLDHGPFRAFFAKSEVVGMYHVPASRSN